MTRSSRVSAHLDQWVLMKNMSIDVSFIFELIFSFCVYFHYFRAVGIFKYLLDPVHDIHPLVTGTYTNIFMDASLHNPKHKYINRQPTF